MCVCVNRRCNSYINLKCKWMLWFMQAHTFVSRHFSDKTLSALCPKIELLKLFHSRTPYRIVFQSEILSRGNLHILIILIDLLRLTNSNKMRCTPRLKACKIANKMKLQLFTLRAVSIHVRLHLTRLTFQCSMFISAEDVPMHTWRRHRNKSVNSVSSSLLFYQLCVFVRNEAENAFVRSAVHKHFSSLNLIYTFICLFCFVVKFSNLYSMDLKQLKKTELWKMVHGTTALLIFSWFSIFWSSKKHIWIGSHEPPNCVADPECQIFALNVLDKQKSKQINVPKLSDSGRTLPNQLNVRNYFHMYCIPFFDWGYFIMW